MNPSAGDERRLKYSGLLVAAIGFALSRITLLVVVDGGQVSAFLLTGFVPLVLGLALTAFGISLAVSTFEPWYVGTVARWTMLGTVGMGAVTGLSLLKPLVADGSFMDVATSSLMVANTLVGGAVGGALIGVRSARSRRQRRAMTRQSNQIVVLDRILRDEVVNAVTSILARVELLRDVSVRNDGGDTSGAEGASVSAREPGSAADDGARSPSVEHLDAIDRGAGRIKDAVEDVGFLVNSGDDRLPQRPVALSPALRDAVAEASRQHPGVSIGDEIDIDDVDVRANDYLETVFAQLFETAVRRHPDGAPSLSVTAEVADRTASVTVTDDGEPMTDKQRTVLTEGRISQYDDPNVGFGYPVVSFLVDQYGGTIAVDRHGDRTRVTLELPLVAGEEISRERQGVEPSALRAATAAALAGGVAMGLVLQTFANTIPVIGSLYGVPSVAVGWTTHLFHSVVFGVLFAAALRRPTLRDRIDSIAATVAAAVGFGLVLAVVAAGVVMPLYLNAVGVPAPVPRLFPAGVAGHVVWGVVFGAGYWLLC